MVFVTIGNATQQFRRLLSAVDALAGAHYFQDEAVLIQCGHTAFAAQHCEQRPFYSPAEYQMLMDSASLIIAHGGAGSLYHAFRAGKVPVVMPRRRIYGEHLDDQLSLVEALDREGRIAAAYEADDLRDAIERARRRSGLVQKPADMMSRLVAESIEELSVEAHPSMRSWGRK